MIINLWWLRMNRSRSPVLTARASWLGQRRHPCGQGCHHAGTLTLVIGPQGLFLQAPLWVSHYSTQFEHSGVCPGETPLRFKRPRSTGRGQVWGLQRPGRAVCGWLQSFSGTLFLCFDEFDEGFDSSLVIFLLWSRITELVLIQDFFFQFFLTFL